MVLSACATPERLVAVPEQQTEQAIPSEGPVRFWADDEPGPLIAEAEARYEREIAERARTGQSGPLPPEDFLAISGGGDDGAFGAGLLCGWTQAGNRPTFTLVTGVSTGALIAPFAFLGPRYDPILREAYTKVSRKNIFRKRIILAALFGDALSDTTPLAHLISRYITRELLDEIAVEYRKEEPLAPVKQMWHTLPLVGTLAAMIGGAAFFTLMMLGQQYLLRVGHSTMLQGGLAFWPQVIGVLITAALLGLLLRTRMLPLLVLCGMLLLIGAGALLLTLRPGPQVRTTVLAAAGLLGLGAGATVSPGLYLAAFPLPSRIVGRIFALVELVRSVADFILAPVMLGVARVASGAMQPNAEGLRFSIWLTLGVTIAFTLAGAALYLLGGAGLPRPDLVAWIERNQPAMGSPPLAQTLRGS